MLEVRRSVVVAWPRPGVARVLLLDEHDASTAAQLEAALTQAVTHARVVVADLTLTSFIDCSTIRELMRARNAAAGVGVGFHVVLGPASLVERALVVTGVLPALNPVATLNDALESASSRGMATLRPSPRIAETG